MTTYTVFMHYYNDAIGKSVTNSSKVKWHSALETTTADVVSGQEKRYIDVSDFDEITKKKNTVEILRISSKTTDTEETTNDYENYILESTRVDNPKYDMLFIYDGLGYFNFKDQKNANLTDDTEYNKTTQLYFDKMKRVNIQPWFFHSTYHSLKSAMTKAESLVDLFGQENILVGKEVDLTQYIEIV